MCTTHGAQVMANPQTRGGLVTVPGMVLSPVSNCIQAEMEENRVILSFQIQSALKHGKVSLK